MELITTQLKARYGDGVDVAYIDLADSANAGEHPEMALLSREASSNLPFVAIGGSLRMTKNVDYRAIVTSIEALLEVRNR